MHTHTRLSLCLLVCVCLCVPILYVQLWDVSSELPRVVHSLGPCCVLAWQPQAGNTGTMLLAGYANSNCALHRSLFVNFSFSGCTDGSINLWLVDYVDGVEAGEVGEGVEDEGWGVKLSTVATLARHQAPITSLQFTNHTSSLLASGCRGGIVRIWDVQVTIHSTILHTHSHACTHTYTHTYSLDYTLAHTRTQTHMHVCAHTHTYSLDFCTKCCTRYPISDVCFSFCSCFVR